MLIFKQLVKYNIFSSQIRGFNKKTRYLQDDYEILGFLGQGSTSRVFMGNNVLTNQKVVIKLFKQIPEDKIIREIRINNKINQYYYQYYYNTDKNSNKNSNDNDNININNNNNNNNNNKNNKNFPFIRLLDIIRNKGCGSFAFIFEHYHGVPLNLTPLALIKSNRLLYMKQILLGLSIIHELKIVNRDIKPSNILITPYGAKLFDFGLSKQKQIDQLKTNRFGTKCYYTPEVVFRMKQYDEKIDVWTTGIIFSQLISLIKPILPFKSDLDTLSQIVQFCQYNQYQDGHVINQNIKKFIYNQNNNRNIRQFELYMYELRKNYHIMNQLNDQHFYLLVKQIKKMLKINPNLRPNAKDVLKNLQNCFNVQQKVM